MHGRASSHRRGPGGGARSARGRRPRVRFLPAGDCALVVEFGNRIDRALNARVLGLAERIEAAGLAGVVETVPTFRSLTVHYDPLLTSGARLTRALRALTEVADAATRPARRWRVPVCYHPSHAPDLVEVARRSGLAPEEVAELHTSVTYYVYMLGFLPGYPYMGDVPAALVLPRRENPRLRVPAGAVGIATTLSAIYPLESPGGWHLIGTTPARIFDLERTPPALFAPGDSIVFTAVTPAEFEAIGADSVAGRYRLPCEEGARCDPR
ncbi:MAG: 5-oxoprolinase subunit PxpB [Gammaproteobacteria bacterium]|nr:5-oxoprolinase subunit PxpB [Gammaproteobacteria bacterium]NIR84376.1 5-oxoprolinase subunit PxpB [Gammaproteobacteria bacterium]NIR90857.1 5-oxoprolinase subunit PxpB [Gammaproteobacteria bacterium]NIU07043.1 5-oxoprolinase subunit PxpB [Gammaproteobacteria bacterium]NIV76172.1 5-oxoprolinase subunit PxpB [Gammaproteobacteria bacterium]